VARQLGRVELGRHAGRRLLPDVDRGAHQGRAVYVDLIKTCVDTVYDLSTRKLEYHAMLSSYVAFQLAPLHKGRKRHPRETVRA
jgi:hypothetical protein